MIDVATGLREKKRELLRSTIERKAVDLVLKHGYQDVTVEMICEECTISQRTFFNYFRSKDTALLGPPPDRPDAAAAEAFVHHPESDVLTDLVRMMTHVLEQRDELDPQLWQDRREIIRGNQQLMRVQAERIAAKDSELAEIVEARLRAHRRVSEAAEIDGDLRREARLIVNLWWGVARYTMQLWAEDPLTTPRQVTADLLTLLTRIKEA
ncbi:TetR family transcriptional regulator [Microlunatus endophyticus]|uniref:TetR family transcriptional regulator n=1 Tax=Microlunatus endophyticus TaxID=1716077 RepID=A0A917W8N7_9ACTN|nr:TetR/AcrR family transcriptional regulator [Microlunatus endophyticus]GGL83699.1 TetR family transcriptional regulator [Microlunatus endophyticus]